MENINTELDKIIDFFNGELGAIRTGRATPALVENIQVEYYGAKSPLKQVASISVSGPREILIQPWNRDNLVDIEKAISESGINISPVNTGEAIKINIPSLTEENRKNFVKILKEKMEEARIKMRRIRDDERKKIQDAERAGEMSEDEKFRKMEGVDKIVNDYNKKIEKMEEDKEKEIMAV
ncbi:MAG: ribosome recycling factor [Patescibacteria group bacterium]